MKAVAFAFLWFFVFSIPWEDSLRLGEGATISKLAGVLAFGAGIAWIVMRRGMRRWHAPMALAALLIAWSASTVIWSGFAGHAVSRALTLVQLFAMFALIWNLVDSPEWLRKLISGYVLGCIVSALGTVRNFTLDKGIADLHGRFAAEGFDPNELGLLLSIGIPLAWHLGSTQRNRLLGWLWWSYLPLAITAILLTASRGALLSAVVSLTIVPWSYGRISMGSRIVTSLGLVGAGYWAIQTVPTTTWERILQLQYELQHGTLTRRRDIWAAGWEVFREHPLAGTGVGTYAPSIEPIYGKAFVAHNTFLSVLVEQGAIGLALFLAFLLVALSGVVRAGGEMRSTWVTVALTWSVGVSALSWEHTKATWFILACAAVYAAMPRLRLAAEPAPAPLPAPAAEPPAFPAPVPALALPGGGAR